MAYKSFKRLAALFIAAAFNVALHAVEPSGTLPVLTITTENNAPILTKTDYVNGAYSLDPKGDSKVEALDGELQIRGRGNYTWTGFEKKPYRIKLASKAPLMGMRKNKHFALLAHADDDLGFLREPTGFKMSELAGMAWTPAQKPVEVILNGDYIGLYFLVETIRVDKDRVDVVDQEDEDPSTDVTGGWLCEIDNYEEDPSEQITLTESNGAVLRVTHKSPEVCSSEQENYLRSQMQAIDNAFYSTDVNSRDWENLVDIESLTKFYVIQEVMDGQESFHGSCYIHRQRGSEYKWTWGPVWDFGNTFARNGDKMIYEDPDWGQTWIHEIVKFKSFQKSYTERFKTFMADDYDPLMDYIDAFANKIADAAKSDAERWPQYGNKDVFASASELKSKIQSRIAFLCNRWGVENIIPTESGIYLRGEMTGWEAQPEYQFTSIGDDRYELRDVSLSGQFKIAGTTWDTINWGVDATCELEAEVENDLIFGNKSQNFGINGDYKRVVLSIKDPENRATILLTNEVEGSIETLPTATAHFSVDGNRIIANGLPMMIADINGRIVADGVDVAELPNGFYLVRQNGQVHKLVIR